MAMLYLIRHGKPMFPDGEKRCVGSTDLPLSEEGRRQMTDLLPFIRQNTIERIYTSPLSRAKESAEILSQGKIPVSMLHTLREIDMGAWENRTFADIRRNDSEVYNRRGRDLFHIAPAGGESFSEVLPRAADAYRTILSQAGNHNLAVVGHEGLFRVLICWLEGRDMHELPEIRLAYGEVFEWDMGPQTEAVLLAAGTSSRMGRLKALMPYADSSFLRYELDQFSRVGVRRTIVVTGFEAEKIRAEAASPNVAFVHNDRYLSTKMFDSALLGFRIVREETKGIFFSPVDCPSFSVFTLQKELEKMSLCTGYVFRPSYRGVSGHPLLLHKNILPFIDSYDGTNGLGGLLEKIPDEIIDIPLPEPGIILDADNPEEYAEICRRKRQSEIPGREDCMELLRFFFGDASVCAHSLAVANRAIPMAKELNKKGFCLNLALVEAGALLHDLGKGKKYHAAAGAAILRSLGMPAVARIAERHSVWPVDTEKLTADMMDEAFVVYLADKLVLGESPCSLEERFSRKAEVYGRNKEVADEIRSRFAQAERAMFLFQQSIGP